MVRLLVRSHAAVRLSVEQPTRTQRRLEPQRRNDAMYALAVLRSTLGSLHLNGKIFSRALLPSAPLARGSIAAVAVELDLSQLHRLSVDEYHRILEAGGFDEDARVELLGGLLAAMSPKTRAHENAVAWLVRWVTQAVDLDAFEVRVASPLTLEDSEPEPDLAVIALNAPRPYHPATATLVIEVAVSSLRRDLATKTELYARAGVAEYWVLALDQRRLTVQRDVRPEVGEYAQRIEFDESARVTPTALAFPELALGEVLAAADV